MSRSAEWPSAAGALVVPLAVGLYLFVGVFDHDVWAPVEPTIAGIVWNMVDSGNLAVPFVNHEPFVEKPPFYYWLAWLGSAATGRLTAGTIRLPAAVLGLGCLGVVFWTARRAWGSRVACVTTLFGALSVMLWDAAHRAASDISAVFFAFVCFGVFARGIDETNQEPGDVRQPWDLTFCIALAASFYAKNVFPLLLVLPPVAVFLLIKRQPRRLGTIVGITGVALIVLLAPWVVAVFREGGWYELRLLFFDNTIGRFLPLGAYADRFSTTMSDAFRAEKEPVLFYLPRLFAYPLPWTAIVLVAVVDLVRRRRATSDLERFLLVGVVTMPIVLSFSSAKSTDYLVPVLFFDLLILARFFAGLFSNERSLSGWERVLLLANLAVGLVLVAVFPLVLFGIFGGAATLLLAPPAAVAAGWLSRRLRTGLPDARWFFDFGVVGVLAATLGLAIAIPEVDREKSYRPFFDEVRPLIGGRPVLTTWHEIIRLPLINYYLRARVRVFDEFEPVRSLLASDLPVAAFIRCETYERQLEELEAMPGLLVVAERERRDVCFVANRHDEAPREPGRGGSGRLSRLEERGQSGPVREPWASAERERAGERRLRPAQPAGGEGTESPLFQ